MIVDAIHPGINLDLEEPIDPEDPRYKETLEHLQGNILKPHGRDHVRLLLLRFTAEPAEARKWLRFFAAEWLTSASAQLREAETHRRNRPTGVFGGLFLTAPGYERLGFTREDLLHRFGDQNERASFTYGMAAAQQMLNDPDPAAWEEPYREPGAIHAMVLLAAGSRRLLASASARAESSLAGVGEVAGRETGTALRDAEGRSLEPFGFADGLSQPVFFRTDLEKEAAKRGGTDVWDPRAPLGLVLVPDPFAEEKDCFGSFLVFRKLEQNVKGFNERLRRVADDYTSGDEALAGAFLVGRFKNGTPVIAYRQSVGESGRDFNNFKYYRDFSGSRCPFHAHVAKTNPRGRSIGSTSTSLQEERLHRIIRRGIPYDDREVRDGEAESGVGLLFLCFQASISNQFAFIQESWASSPDFPRPPAGVDPLIGRANAGQDPRQQWQPVWDWDRDNKTPIDFGRFVTLKGGEFFFAPSIPFLKGL
jgi:Dyp-type peroxidase family